MARPKHRRPALHRTLGEAPIPLEFQQLLFIDATDERHRLLEALSDQPPVSIRLNPAKPFDMDEEPVPWCGTGRYLTQRPSFTLDPLLHAGAYYVQEASSMLLEQAFLATGLNGPLLALDLCAAPGGKTTHLLSMLPPESLLIANETHPERRRVLMENCWKQGAPNVIISSSIAYDLASLTETFDLILVDAPCSGEGMFRKDMHARAQWSPALVQQCSRIQSDLLRRAWDALSPGGALVYSTCTWEAVENEERVAELVRLGAECLPMHLSEAWGVERSTKLGVEAYRCYPHRVRGEGLFIAVLRKPGRLRARSLAAPHDARRKNLSWLGGDMLMDLVESEGKLHARPAAWAALIDSIGRSIRITAPGVPFAERKGDGWQPHPAAALSHALRRSALPVIELDMTEAIGYLRGETLITERASGHALATYQGLALGWLRGAGTRWNNRWPAAWRIRQRGNDGRPVPWSKE